MESDSAAEREAINIVDLSKHLAPDWSWDQWFEWPPDVFALTSVFLRATGLYRYVVSPLEPGKRLDVTWTTEQEEKKANLICKRWYRWILDPAKRFPPELRKIKASVRRLSREVDAAPSGLADDRMRVLRSEILYLHALADMACAGFGSPSQPYGLMSEVYLLANLLLESRGTLSRLHKRGGIVVPKMRTPQTGLTIRSFSHYVAYEYSEVEVLWRSIPWLNDDRSEDTVNLLAIPWPEHISSNAFKPCFEAKPPDFDPRGYKYFKYEPGASLDVNEVVALVSEASKEVDRIHLLVFPELALTEDDLRRVKAALVESIPNYERIPVIVAGVRSAMQNRVVLSVFFAGKWYDLGQHKHHRWKLDSRQIQQYGLAGSLNAHDLWWEGIELKPRALTFLAPNRFLTLCPLICEDLAQLEPVSGLIRGVGPTLVIAILLDGPQIPERWSARYVGVLADDPGSSVLTVTSLGMAKRSQAKGMGQSSAATFWKDREGSWTEEMKPGDKAVLLTINARMTEEFTADGRSDGGMASMLVLRSMQMLKTSPVGSPGPDQSHPGAGSVANTGSSEDLYELGILSCLIDSVIDSPVLVIERLKSLALLDESLNKLPGRGPVKHIVRQVQAWVRMHFGESPDGAWPRPDFRSAVELLCQTVSDINQDAGELTSHDGLDSERHKGMTRWTALIDMASARLAEQDTNNDVDGRPGSTDRDEARTARVVFLAILWTLHNRLMEEKRRAEDRDRGLARHYRALLARIEGLLHTHSTFPLWTGPTDQAIHAHRR